MKPGSKPKAVNNIADLRKPMWVGLARKPQWRCLIPLTAWAEPAGIKGSTTRTWLSLKDRPIFAGGGLWRDSAEWGPVYAGAMTDANEVEGQVHHRMPVIDRKSGVWGTRGSVRVVSGGRGLIKQKKKT